jgi:hypothetical protein
VGNQHPDIERCSVAQAYEGNDPISVHSRTLGFNNTEILYNETMYIPLLKYDKALLILERRYPDALYIGIDCHITTLEDCFLTTLITLIGGSEGQQSV